MVALGLSGSGASDLVGPEPGWSVAAPVLIRTAWGPVLWRTALRAARGSHATAGGRRACRRRGRIAAWSGESQRLRAVRLGGQRHGVQVRVRSDCKERGGRLGSRRRFRRGFFALPAPQTCSPRPDAGHVLARAAASAPSRISAARCGQTNPPAGHRRGRPARLRGAGWPPWRRPGAAAPRSATKISEAPRTSWGRRVGQGAIREGRASFFSLSRLRERGGVGACSTACRRSSNRAGSPA